MSQLFWLQAPAHFVIFGKAVAMSVLPINKSGAHMKKNHMWEVPKNNYGWITFKCNCLIFLLHPYLHPNWNEHQNPNDKEINVNGLIRDAAKNEKPKSIIFFP